MLTKALWESINFSSLQIEEWNEEFTVFQADSGKTHFLNKMGLQIISSLDQSPKSMDEICEILIDQFKLTPDKDFPGNIAKTLHRFDTLGLVKKIRMESSA